MFGLQIGAIPYGSLLQFNVEWICLDRCHNNVGLGLETGGMGMAKRWDLAIIVIYGRTATRDLVRMMVSIEYMLLGGLDGG